MRLWPAGRGSPQAIKLTHGLPTQFCGLSLAYEASGARRKPACAFGAQRAASAVTTHERPS
jgi:hypothetical protein